MNTLSNHIELNMKHFFSKNEVFKFDEMSDMNNKGPIDVNLQIR